MISMAAGRTPSGVENARVAGVWSKKQKFMSEVIAVHWDIGIQPEVNTDLRLNSEKLFHAFAASKAVGTETIAVQS